MSANPRLHCIPTLTASQSYLPSPLFHHDEEKEVQTKTGPAGRREQDERSRHQSSRKYEINSPPCPFSGGATSSSTYEIRYVLRREATKLERHLEDRLDISRYCFVRAGNKIRSSICSVYDTLNVEFNHIKYLQIGLHS